MELDSLISWLTNFINESKTIDNQVNEKKKKRFILQNETLRDLDN